MMAAKTTAITYWKAMMSGTDNFNDLSPSLNKLNNNKKLTILLANEHNRNIKE